MSKSTRTLKGRRMVGLKLNATAGVGHGANAAQMNGAEGWLVMRSDGTPVSPANLYRRVRATPTTKTDDAPDTICPTCVGVGLVTPGSAAYGRTTVPTGAAPGTARTCPDCSGGQRNVEKAAPRSPVAKDDAWSAIEAAAAEHRTKAAAAGNPMTVEKSIAEITELRPDLAAAWRTAAPDPAVPPVVAKAEPDPRAAAADVVNKRAEALAAVEGISLSKALDRVLDSTEGLALRAVHASTHGRRHEVEGLAGALRRRRL